MIPFYVLSYLLTYLLTCKVIDFGLSSMCVSGVLVEGPRPNLVPPLRPLTDLRKLLMAVKRSLPMSAEARLYLLWVYILREREREIN